MGDEKLWAKLDALGVAQVRANLATNVYLGPEHPSVLLWLEQRKEASSAEQLELARRASDDARAANTAAREANKIARIALIIAAISVILAAIGLFYKP